MKKTLLVTLLLTLGPVAASADAIRTGDKGLQPDLGTACALQSPDCTQLERRVRDL